MADEKKKGGSEEETPKKKSKKLLIIIIAAVVALGGGGFAGYMIFKPASGKAKATVTPKPSPGIVVVLDAITINLADGHYLKLKMSLQMTLDAGEETVDGSHALDLAINEYSNRPMAELFSNEERNKTKEELLEKVKEAYEKKVMDIYFTTFVIQ
jgi:flagellar FliL protein